MNIGPAVTCDWLSEPHPYQPPGHSSRGCKNPRPWGDPKHTPYLPVVEHTDPPNIIRGEN